MTRGRRRIAGAVGTLAMLLALGAQGVAGAVLWTMTASPLAATVGTPTSFTLTATNLDPLLGIKCVVAEIPAAIAPGDVWIAGSSTTAAWVAFRSGQQVTAVIDTGDGNAKLRVGDWVAFGVTGVPLIAGAYAIPAVAYSNHACTEGVRPLAASPVLVISEGLLPPPDPTPAPTPTPDPIIALPSIVPTLPPLLPVRPTPRATPRATPVAPAGGAVQGPSSPAALPTAASTPAAAPASQIASVASPTPGAAGAPESAAGNDDASLAVAPRSDPDDELGLQLGPITVLEGIGVWAVPGAVVGGPGLVVILWVVIQAGVAMAWMPAVRRLRGDGRIGGVARRT
jgi:hypothetical protein